MEIEYFYVGYEDSGPSGPCGQCMSVTSNWRKLYIFIDYQKAKDFIDSVNNRKMRRINPRIVGFWSETRLQEEQVVRIS